MKKNKDREKKGKGLKYKIERVKLGLSQSQVAKKLEVSQYLISAVESGQKQSPRVIRLPLIFITFLKYSL